MKRTDVIKKPLITEKGAVMQQSGNCYLFAVDRRATKRDVREAVEDLFKVKVDSVRTLVMPSKYKRVGKNIGIAPEWKKAVVTLAQGEKIELVESA